ncbi:MAG: trimeric intracellular cation channel family protein [Pyrinomonadaceae bacterium]|nr:trimeric intracellular cation channel family protein [Pyrinomonadaceae bacterium]
MNFVIGIVEFFAILTFAYSGLIEAKRKEMDFVGSCTLALVTAFGGGTLRDILLDRRPLYWIDHYEYPIIIFVLAAAVLVIFRFNREILDHKILTYIDALGLGLFSASGVAIALETGIPIFPASLIGVITATTGGVIRDILCNEIPIVFRRETQLYVTCSFVGTWTFISLDYLGFKHIVGLLACTLAAASLRLAAVKFNIRLPL